MIHADGIRIEQGDCAEYLKGFPTQSVDAVVTDPPYANGTAYETYADTRENLERLIASFLPQARRVARVVAITPGVANMYLYPEPTWILNWVVPAGTGSGPWGFSCWQPILVYGKDPYLASGRGRRPDTFITYRSLSENVAHPCPKPVSFMEWLVKRVTTASGAVVIDPMMGSGTTALACMLTRRNFFGVDINPTYVAVAQTRVNELLTRPQILDEGDEQWSENGTQMNLL